MKIKRSKIFKNTEIKMFKTLLRQSCFVLHINCSNQSIIKNHTNQNVLSFTLALMLGVELVEGRRLDDVAHKDALLRRVTVTESTLSGQVLKYNNYLFTV